MAMDVTRIHGTKRTGTGSLPEKHKKALDPMGSGPGASPLFVPAFVGIDRGIASSAREGLNGPAGDTLRAQEDDGTMGHEQQEKR